MLHAAILAGERPERTGPDPSFELPQPGPPAAPAAPRSEPARTLLARQDELARLERHLAAALAGETGLAFVSGDPGSGKTALLEAFAASAAAKYPDLLLAGARCAPGGHLDPLAPLRRLAAMLCGAAGGEVGWRLPGAPDAARSPETARPPEASNLVLACLREFGTDLVGTLVPVFSTGSRDPGRARTESLSQGALFDQLTATLAAIARRRPLLLLLDDLQWADEATVAYLLHLARELSSSRLLLLGAYRSTAVSLGRLDVRLGELARHPLAQALNELRQSKGDIRIDLDRADGRSFVEALVDMEANRLGGQFRDALYAQTGGHPLFTIETLHNLQDRGQFVRDEAGRWTAPTALDWGSLPARIDAAIAERIERLPSSERRILSAACVQGDDFSAEMVAELTGLPLDDVLAALIRSLARQHRLVQPEGLQRAGAAQRPERAWSIYRFSHHLFRLRAAAEQDGEEDLLAIALLHLGAILHHLGRITESEARLEAAVALGMQERLSGAYAVTGYSVAPSGLGYSALNAWFLGYPDRAVARCSQAIALAAETGDRFGQVMAAVLGAVLAYLLRDGDFYAERCAQGRRLAVESGFDWWRAFCDVLLGRLPLEGAPSDEGIERMRRGLSGWEGLGMAVGSDFLALVYADGCLAAAGQRANGRGGGRRELLETAGAALAAPGPGLAGWGRVYEAEFVRLQGEVLLALQGPTAAEEALGCFRRALALGREHGAPAWQLRAAMSMVRLRQRQGEADAAGLQEARAALAVVLAGFTEGFGSGDLQEAASLLHEQD